MTKQKNTGGAVSKAKPPRQLKQRKVPVVQKSPVPEDTATQISTKTLNSDGRDDACGIPVGAIHPVPAQLGVQALKRQDEFPVRTARLEELAKVGDDIAGSVRRYESDHRLLCNDLEFIVQMLEHTLDDPPDQIHYSTDSRDSLLQYSASALEGLANVVDIMQSTMTIPFRTDELRRIAESLSFILDPEGKCHYAVETDQHWAEVDLAESGLCSLKQQVKNLRGFIEVGGNSSKPLRGDHGKDASHSEDFRCVKWYGTVYDFTTGQAGAVQRLWEAWESGMPSISSIIVTEASGGDSKRVRDLFKGKGKVMHLAWKTMICKQGRDQYFLHPPENSENPM